VAAESWNSEARAKRPFVSNDKVNTKFPLQRWFEIRSCGNEYAEIDQRVAQKLTHIFTATADKRRMNFCTWCSVSGWHAEIQNPEVEFESPLTLQDSSCYQTNRRVNLESRARSHHGKELWGFSCEVLTDIGDLCYSYSNLESIIINCSYDMWVSSKSIYQPKFRFQVTNRRDNITKPILRTLC
jgi:hypothetical protein